MTNMLSSLMEKIYNIKEQADNIQRVKNVKKEPKRTARNIKKKKNTLTEIKNALKVLSVDWAQLRKDSLN